MPKVVFTLKSPSAQSASLSGAKGATLAKMTKAGLPIPSGFVISTKAFQAISRKISAQLKGLKDLDASDLKALQKISDNIRQIIEAYELPKDTIAQIKRAYNALGKPAISVRSSSTTEDLRNTSFAGQYDTFLNVSNIDDLIQNTKNVWASLYSPHAIGYSLINKISYTKAKMAVVIQQQLTPNAAGVLFTQDPVSGEEHYVVSAALGLGEGVVSGSAQTDRFVLDPKTGKVLSSEIATKEAQVVANKKGGIETATIAKTKQDKPALSRKQLATLTKYGRQLAKRFKSPQDIEFAVTGNDIHILQARPMTALEEAVKPDEPWDKGISKRFHWQYRSGPFNRLEEALSFETMKQMRVCYEETGSSMTVNHMPHISNGYLFVRAKEHNKKTLKKLHALQTRRVNACLKQGKSYFEGALRSIIEDRLSELKDMRKTATTFADWVNYLEAAMKTCAYVQGNLHWRQGKPGQRLSWTDEFHKITGRPEIEAHTLTQAVQNRMTRLIAKIRQLARIIQKDPQLKKIFIERQFDALTSPNIQKRKQAKHFQTQFKAMMRVYGQRTGRGYGASSNFATPTWNIDNTLIFDIIATYVEQDLNKLDKHDKETRAERIKATRKIRQELASNPRKLKRFDEVLKNAILMVRFLEDHNYYMEQCTVGTMREAMQEVGQKMVDQNLIDAPDDIFHFSIPELKKLARAKNLSDQRDLVRLRIGEREHRKRMNPPRTLGAKPKPSNDKKEDESDVGLQGNIIKGAPASKGRVTGKAVVALPNKPKPKVHPGDILVAPNVGPDWTPIFAIIGGLVLDFGSLSQHAALVAREYRVPSVMQTKDASTAITHGQTITVDGDNGIVELGG